MDLDAIAALPRTVDFDNGFGQRQDPNCEPALRTCGAPEADFPVPY